ncbi:sulfatase-like hydrolase/transferase [Shimia sp. R11_0]|uniref:sulfatase-like hydrolase/transferase n=1 Tax=Shimia sp. R11_0 TaxID=2821096 RepID=UPI001ADA5429|nr:sulfatase-like hydrolase/transferase [Shimia sp. R11_0]MBO9478073.1 sulfatase-like hydrolase/transferase [Shimia sp. R11_0]
MTKKKLNVLFITADQWRGDCLGLAGHGVVKTPHTDALAAEGTAFLQHYSAAAPCSPARAAMYTGLWQMNNRGVANGSPLAHRFDNMARAARRAGYRPTLFGYTDISADPRSHAPEDPALKTYEGILPGFEVEQELIGNAAPWRRWLKSLGYGPEVTETPYQLAEQEGERISTAPTGFAAEHSQTAYLTGRLIEWVEEQPSDQPWFAHLSLIHPHPPFGAPAPYNTMYAPEEGPGFAEQEEELAKHPVISLLKRNTRVSDYVPGAEAALDELTEADFRRIRAVYYGLISEVDAQIGRLMDRLKELGVWDNTLVILTSDHGEMMGDHGLLGKGGFFPESQHIPLVMRLPGAPAGQVCEGLTSAIDLMPTLLELWGVEPSNSLDGRSLMPQLQNAGAPPREAVFWEFDFRSNWPAPEGVEPRDYARGSHLLARLGAEALQVRCPNAPDLLFDRKKDPGCTRNVLNDPDYIDLRLKEAEALIADRMRANEQTLCNLRLSDNGATDLFGT